MNGGQRAGRKRAIRGAIIKQIINAYFGIIFILRASLSAPSEIVSRFLSDNNGAKSKWQIEFVFAVATTTITIIVW